MVQNSIQFNHFSIFFFEYETPNMECRLYNSKQNKINGSIVSINSINLLICLRSLEATNKREKKTVFEYKTENILVSF